MATPESKGKAINQRIQQEQKGRVIVEKTKANGNRQTGDGINRSIQAKVKGK